MNIKDLMNEYYDLDNDYKNGWCDFWKPETWERYDYLMIILHERGLI